MYKELGNGADQALFREESGQDLIEYGLLIGVITTGVIATIGAIGPRVKAYYDDTNGQLK